MTFGVRTLLFIMLATSVGCASSPQLVSISKLRTSQRYARKLHNQSKTLVAERDEARQMALSLEQQNQVIAQQHDALPYNR